MTDGDVYRGKWRRNIIHGQGRYEYSTGDVYEGNRVGKMPSLTYDFLLNLVTHRVHTLHCPECNPDGVIMGHGTMMAANGDVYTGNFVDGKRHGKGDFKYADGSRYVGRWVGNVIHGFGEFWSSEGWSYKGW